MSLHILPCGGFLTCADVYQYGEFIFEFHPYLGPSLCRKNGELSNRVLGPKSRFWVAFEEWQKLSEDEREKTRWQRATP